MELFFQIPGHNQTDVLKKVKYRDFIRFMKCSRKTLEIARNFTHRVSMDVDSILFSKYNIRLYTTCSPKFLDLRSVLNDQVRFVANQIFIDHGNWNRTECLNICRNLKAKKLYVDRLLSTEKDISGEDGYQRFPLKALIKLLQMKSLMITRCPFVDDLAENNKLQEIKTTSIQMEASAFLLLHVPKIAICDYESLPLSCFNKFFKQWLAGERIVEKLSVTPFPNEYSDIFRDLHFVVEDVSEVPEDLRKQCDAEFNMFSLTRNGDKRKLYVLFCRSSRIPWFDDVQMIAGEGDSMDNWISSVFLTN